MTLLRRMPWRALLEHGGPPLVWLVLVVALHPFRSVFAYDADEGNNLMKARLVADGHELYSTIWSDQPPLFTHALRFWLEAVGWSVENARLLVLLCSAALVWALFQSVRLSAGRAAAVVACMLLVLSFGFARLSVSVMLGVPSLALAMAAIYAALRSGAGARAGWAVLSGALLAAAALVKLWVIAMAPAVLAALAALAPHVRDEPGGAEPARGEVPAAAWWLAGFLPALLLMLLLTVAPEHLGQLLRPHVDARDAGDFDAHALAFAGHFGRDLGLMVLAATGAGWAAVRRFRPALPPVVWLVIAGPVLAVHEPLWYHHYLLVSIPMCWLAGLTGRAAVDAALREALRHPRGAAGIAAWSLAAVVALAVAFQVRGAATTEPARGNVAQPQRDRYVTAVMAHAVPAGQTVVTDRQILAFRAGRRVPPELAVTSLKRRWSGRLSDARLLAVIGRRRPAAVFLCGRRLPVTADLLDALVDGYRLIYGDPWGGVLLLREDLADDPIRALRAAAAEAPACWEAQLNLAAQLRRAGRPDAAAAASRRALDLLPPDPAYAPLRRGLTRLVSVAE